MNWKTEAEIKRLLKAYDGKVSKLCRENDIPRTLFNHYLKKYEVNPNVYRYPEYLL